MRSTDQHNELVLDFVDAVIYGDRPRPSRREQISLHFASPTSPHHYEPAGPCQDMARAPLDTTISSARSAATSRNSAL